MSDGSEFQTATLKPREAKVVWTRGTDNRLEFVERRERVGVSVIIQKGMEVSRLSGAETSLQGFIQPPRRSGELPPETKLLPLEKDHQLPPSGGVPVLTTADTVTRPLHANFLLQHETEGNGIHTTKKIKIVGHYVNTTVDHSL